MMKRGEHLTSSGLNSIMNIRASMNRGLTPANFFLYIMIYKKK
jgi:hypothetical protein